MNLYRTHISALLTALLVVLGLCTPAFAQPSLTVHVENPLEAERPDEVVSLPWSALTERLPGLTPERVRVVAADTRLDVPVQTVDADGDGGTDELLFLASFWPEQSRAFQVQASAPVRVATSRAHVTHDERRDDIAWENDRIAFRTYGEGLWELEDLTSSGVDVWTKRTDDLVIDRWYADGHYHTDTGEGADFFSVGATLGAGGTAVWRGDSLYGAPNFSSYRILADGPLRAVVELEYAPWDAGGLDVAETRRITIDAGQPLYRQESTFLSDDAEAIPYAIGLVEREGMTAATNASGQWAWVSGWGPVGNGGHGELGTAVLTPSHSLGRVEQRTGHVLAVSEAPEGQPVTHYVGAGWTAGGAVDDAEDWWAVLDAFAERLAHPVAVRFVDTSAFDPARALERAADRLRPLLGDVADSEGIPRSVENGALRAGTSREWTSGFYPGMLWYLYEFTGDAAFEDAARRWTALVEPEKENAGTHDMGFKVYNSFGSGYRLTQEPHYRDVIVESARTLMTRYDPVVGAIRSWDFGDWAFPVIIDNMMNLELLFAAAELTGEQSFYDVAVEHARTTLQHHFREDASSYHVVDYDTLTGEVVSKGTHQGYTDESAWSRGQAWGLYGFTMVYRETQDAAFLEQAKRIADFILTHPNLPDDYVPYWDYDAPDVPSEPRDASAAAVTASALYELSQYVDDDEQARYVQAADRMLASLASPAYRAPAGTPGPFLLTHSTGSVPGDFEVDGPLIYADYYYVEAFMRRLRLHDAP